MKIEIPVAVMDGALAVAYPGGYEQQTANVEGAVEHVVAWLAKEYRLDDPRHLVKVDSDGWTVQHPLTCRPNLFTCPWSDPDHLVIARAIDKMEPEPAAPGRTYVGEEILDPHGLGTVRLALGVPVEEDERVSE
jgi:hypothetical protein